ncbi:MAG: PHP domain-containing protein [Candidatus Marinimicrobia bacterium]|nr:PHP domain-containing protein [Candidatus Neomarinimicrobiota bacterium]
MCDKPLVICKSHYTFLEGIHSIPELVEFAVEYDVKALCLADRDGFYGVVEFYLCCREAGIQPLVGVELTQEKKRVIVIVRNREGYEELSEIITRRQLKEFHLEDDLPLNSPNLLTLCDDAFLLQRWLRNGSSQRRESHDSLMLGLPLSDRNAFRRVLNLMARRSDLPRIPAVPFVRLNLFGAQDVPLYKVLRAINLGCTVETLPQEEAYVWERGESATAVLHCSETISYEPVLEAADVAKLCDLRIDLGRCHLPKFVPAV